MAERDLSAAMLAAIVANTVRPALFVEAEIFEPGTGQNWVRVWSGLGSFTWDSKTWIGAGQLLGVSALDESTELKAASFQVSLSGQPTLLMSRALQAVKANRPGKLWLGIFDGAGTLLADPYPLKRGLTSKPVIVDNGETCTITIEYRDRRASLEIPKERRYTNEDQQQEYPGDLGFEFVEKLQDAVFAWPR